MNRRTWAAVGLSLAVCVVVALAALLQHPPQVAKPVGVPRLPEVPAPPTAPVVPPKAAPSDRYAPTVEDIQRDLKLVFTMRRNPVLDGGSIGGESLAVENTSKTSTYRVPPFGHGSNEGFRQPHVFFTAEQRGPDGVWREVGVRWWHECKLGMCIWQGQTVELPPGAALLIDPWMPEFEFLEQGPARVTAHYSYRPRESNHATADLPVKARGKMEECPAFTLSSEPVEVEVRRSHDVRAKALKSVKVGEPVQLAEVFEVTLTNRTGGPLELREVGKEGSQVWINIPSQLYLQRDHFEYAQVYGREKALDAGKSVTVFGPGDFTNSARKMWTPTKSGTFRVRVEYLPYSGSRSGDRIVTETEVTVEP